MATHSIVFAWKILWTEEPGALQFMGLQRVRQTEHTYKPSPVPPHPRPTPLVYFYSWSDSYPLQGLPLEPHPQVPQVPASGASSESALEVLLVPAWERGCLCFAELSWQGTGKQQVAMHCLFPELAPIRLLPLLHVAFSVEASSAPSSKLRFTSPKKKPGHCWTMLISAKARCIFSWGLWQSTPKWSLFNKGICSNWKKKKLYTFNQSCLSINLCYFVCI